MYARMVYLLIHFFYLIPVHPLTHKQFSSSPVWYVWWEFFQTAEFGWHSIASHGTHACSLSTPMPPPLTAVHSPSTRSQTDTNTEHNHSHSRELHGPPPWHVPQSDIIQLHLIFLFMLTLLHILKSENLAETDWKREWSSWKDTQDQEAFKEHVCPLYKNNSSSPRWYGVGWQFGPILRSLFLGGVLFCFLF